MSTDEILARLWAEAEAPEPEPEPPFGDSAWPEGTPVRVTGIDPNWGYACAGHPVIGSLGVISRHLCPEGKSSVSFHGDEDGNLSVQDSRGNVSEYTGLRDEDDDPITLFLPDDCLEVVP